MLKFKFSLIQCLALINSTTVTLPLQGVVDFHVIWDCYVDYKQCLICQFFYLYVMH